MSQDAPSTAVKVPVGDATLDGDLVVPLRGRGLILFAHGSGSSRHSPRNRFVAECLQRAGLGTLLVDLLTRREEEIDNVTAELRFDIGMLSRRLTAIVEWLPEQPEVGRLPLGIFGASTGAAAALFAAARRPDRVRAVVSRGGRPDLAHDALPLVQAPTLLIVGGDDPQVEALNREAIAELHCEKQLVIIAGATHLFEQPGMLEQVAELARDWFLRYLAHQTTQGRVA